MPAPSYNLVTDLISATLERGIGRVRSGDLSSDDDAMTTWIRRALTAADTSYFTTDPITPFTTDTLNVTIDRWDRTAYPERVITICVRWPAFRLNATFSYRYQVSLPAVASAGLPRAVAARNPVVQDWTWNIPLPNVPLPNVPLPNVPLQNVPGTPQYYGIPSQGSAEYAAALAMFQQNVMATAGIPSSITGPSKPIVGLKEGLERLAEIEEAIRAEQKTAGARAWELFNRILVVIANAVALDLALSLGAVAGPADDIRSVTTKGYKRWRRCTEHNELHGAVGMGTTQCTACARRDNGRVFAVQRLCDIILVLGSVWYQNLDPAAAQFALMELDLEPKKNKRVPGKVYNPTNVKISWGGQMLSGFVVDQVIIDDPPWRDPNIVGVVRSTPDIPIELRDVPEPTTNRPPKAWTTPPRRPDPEPEDVIPTDATELRFSLLEF